VFAQNSNAFQDDMNLVFQVNRNYVTTGLLKDYGLQLVELSNYNGTIQTNNIADRSAWQSIYSTLYYMKFNFIATLYSPAVVNSTLSTYTTTSNGLPVNNLLALHYNYEQFKTNAATGNLVYVSSGKIYDTPNRPTTPYDIKTAFSMVPQYSELRGGTHVFRFRNELFFKNVNKTISTAQVDFNDGAGYRTLTIGQAETRLPFAIFAKNSSSRLRKMQLHEIEYQLI
jgi:hypothetical protein